MPRARLQTYPFSHAAWHRVMKRLRINNLPPQAGRGFGLAGELAGRRSKVRQTTPETTRDSSLAARITNPDVIAVIFLCVIACLIAANLILRVPNAGLLIAQFNEFL